MKFNLLSTIHRIELCITNPNFVQLQCSLLMHSRAGKIRYIPGKLLTKQQLRIKYKVISLRKDILYVDWCQGFRHIYHSVLGLVATYAIAYDCVVVRAYACCHLSRYIISVVFCSLIPLVVSASLNSQYNSEFHLDIQLQPVHYLTSDQEYIYLLKIF